MRRALLFCAAISVALACGDNITEPIPNRTTTVTQPVSFATTTTEYGPSISTDKPDYVPGEPVMMYGVGWELEEEVLLTLREDPQIHPERIYRVTADSLGNFEYDQFAPEEHHAGVGFLLTAVGQSSGLEAQTTFTDAVAQGGFFSGTNGTAMDNRFSLMLSAPAAIANDLLIAQVTVAKDIPSTEVVCPPTGWVHIVTTKYSNSGTSKINQSTYYRIATGVEPSTVYTWNFRQTNCAGALTTTPRGAAGGIIRYTGVDVNHAGGPIEGFGGAGTGSTSSTTATAPSVPATAGAMVVRVFGAFKNTTFTPAAMPPRVYTIASANNSTDRTAAAFNATLLAGPNTGTFDATLGSSGEWLAQTIALRMAVVCTTPSITTHPVGASKTAGESVTFSVTATGTGLTYQWRKGGTAISGATNASYTIPSVAASDAGSYDVVVTGDCGTPVTSNAATLTVTQRSTTTTVTASPSPSVFGQVVTFEATVSPASGSGTPTGSVNFIEGGTCESPTTTHASAVALSVGKASLNTGGLSVATHTITACYSSDAQFASSEDDVQHIVNQAPSTTSITLVSPSPAILGQQVTVNFTVVPTNSGTGYQYASTPSGTVDVKDASNNVLCSGTVATSNCNFSPAGAGTLSLTASYQGDANFLASNSAAVSILVKYNFSGFFAPVDRPNTLNVSKAGQAIPLKWRLTDANGQGITDLTSVAVQAVTFSCSAGSTTDLVEEYAASTSGLQNQGDGYYQFNWKTPPDYLNTCKKIALVFGAGAMGYTETPSAFFTFKK